MSEYYSDPTQNPRSREYKGPRSSLKDLFPYLKPHGKALALAQPLLIGQLITAVEQSIGFG
ncbi:MAG: hypothetical protein EBZ10_03150, partial [Actinobacteria bacterium]|nr:hypothetical protein [Actinomycetota bacterium]